MRGRSTLRRVGEVSDQARPGALGSRRNHSTNPLETTPAGAVIIVASSHCCCPSRSTEARRPTLSAPSSARTFAYSIRGSPSIHTGYSEKCRAGGRLTLGSPFVSAIASTTSYGERPPRCRSHPRAVRVVPSTGNLAIAAIALGCNPCALACAITPASATLNARWSSVRHTSPTFPGCNGSV